MGKVATPPRHLPHGSRRKYFTETEYKRLRNHIRRSPGRNQLRDELLVQLTWMHALRMSEAATLRWADVLFEEGQIYVRRVKGSASGAHHLTGDEMRRLRALKRINDAGSPSPFVFLSERGTPLSDATARDMIMTAAAAAGLSVRNPHALRHGAAVAALRRGFTVFQIQQLLGHRSLKTTSEYLRDVGAMLPPTLD